MPHFVIKDMPYKHGTLPSTISESVVVEPPCEQGALSSTTSNVSIKKGETHCMVGILSGTVGKVFRKKGEAISSLARKATSDEEGSQKR